MPPFSEVYNKWERQDSNLRRKPSTDLQSVAFDHSATLPFPGRGPLNGFQKKKEGGVLLDWMEGNALPVIQMSGRDKIVI